jgi:hypothetical protein
MTSHVDDNFADHDHMLDSVRSAMALHGGSAPDMRDFPAESAGNPRGDSEPALDQQHADQHEANAAAAERVASLLAQPEERKQGRDAKGRFASAAAASVDQLSGPPTSWSEQAKAEFARLSPEVQQAVLKRETEMQNGRQQWQDEQGRLRDIEQVIAPRREMYARMGVKNDAEAVAYIFNLAEVYDRDPAGFLAHSLQGTQMSRDQAIGMANMLYQRAGLNPQGGPSPQHLEQLKAQWIQESLPHVQQYVQEQVQAALRQAEEQRHAQERVRQKSRAANASLHGAPYGSGNVTPIRKGNSGSGSFGEIADAVREAMHSLG